MLLTKRLWVGTETDVWSQQQTGVVSISDTNLHIHMWSEKPLPGSSRT